MKKIISLLLLGIALVFMAAWGGQVDYYEEYDYDYGADEVTEGYTSEPEDAVLDFEPSIPLDAAAGLFAQVQAIWDEDDGELFGLRLDAPLMIADPLTRHAVTNRPPVAATAGFQRQGNVYVGILPDNVFISHTAQVFAGRTWGMVSWQPDFYEILADGYRDALILMLHEAFHAIQNPQVVRGGWLPNIDQSLDFMNHSADARIAVLMEIKALATALRTQGGERMAAIHDALSIREHRRNAHPQAARNENAQEINEGLASFTEFLVFEDIDEFLARYEAMILERMETTGLNTIFPYFTGAMYALLLRDTGTEWWQNLTFATDLGGLLKEALGIETTPFDQLDLELWGYWEIAPGQRAWVEEFIIMQQAAEVFVRGDRMTITGDNFIEDTIHVESFWVAGGPLGRFLVFYGQFVSASPNWRLYTNNGFISPEFYPNAGLSVKCYDNLYISEDGLTVTAPTWTLEVTNPYYEAQLNLWGNITIRERQ
ncbi:MAG: hypothetical protein FWE21_03345 [Defluviitaleaceae bacterium]|nr:hypothetical protein [Defluviitaleaceae bacterium]